MGSLLDTSVLVQALVEELPGHEIALETLQTVSSEPGNLLVSSHALAELCATLSALPISPRLGPAQARHLVCERILAKASVIPLSDRDYESIIRRVSGLGLSGGAVYDALHVPAAEKAGADTLYTFNRRDFRRIPSSSDLEFVFL